MFTFCMFYIVWISFYAYFAKGNPLVRQFFLRLVPPPVAEGRVTLSKQMNFRKGPRLRGAHFQSKYLCCRFWTLKQGFLSMKLTKKIAIWFSENEGEGSKAVWIFSKNSSVLVASPVRYYNHSLQSWNFETISSPDQSLQSQNVETISSPDQSLESWRRPWGSEGPVEAPSLALNVAWGASSLFFFFK